MKTMISATLVAAGLAVPAQAQDAQSIARDGLHIEARATYETPTVSSVLEDDDVYKLGSAFAFGGEIGYDIAVGRAVTVGPYAQYEVSTVETCVDGDCVSVENYFEAGATIGYALSPRCTASSATAA